LPVNYRQEEETGGKYPVRGRIYLMEKQLFVKGRKPNSQGTSFKGGGRKRVKWNRTETIRAKEERDKRKPRHNLFQ